MTYSMYDLKGRGDSGGMSTALVPIYDPKTKEFLSIEYENDTRPRVGVAMRVGSIYARTMQHQDWWQTTLVAEIITDDPDQVVFKTISGSTYTWKTF